MISIIICSYNQEQFIEQSIRSAIAQTYDDLELIVSDDASTDGTMDVIYSFEKEMKSCFSNLLIIHHEVNMGLSKNLKNAISKASGEWVKILYGDDILNPEAIDKCAKFVDSHPEVVMIHSSYYKCDENGTYESVNANPGAIYYPIKKDVTAVDLFNNYYIVSPTVFIKRDVYFKSLDEEIGIDDWGTYLEVSLNYNIEYLDYPTVYFRILTNSMSHFAFDEIGKIKFRRMLKCEIQVLDKYKDDNRLDGKRAIINCCNQAASIAVDSKYYDIYNEIRKYAVDNDCDISLNIKIKYLMSKCGILKSVQKVKRLMGIETGNSR